MTTTDVRGHDVDMELTKENITYVLAALRRSERVVKPQKPGRSPKRSPKKRKKRVARQSEEDDTGKEKENIT